ncbi:beta-galactosidase [Fibrobacter sp.]|uniref:beta-galactosidase n=1 Tax=Fibrobacter sp. TaxID=35828 RepID=UPI0026134A75|nr:beta-galactosidase [Fibrobacter sp.]MDD7499111.1 beta-galactosidase [Fibrobacter sp.]MDY5723760.1 beta-galactosidase [Fibrobacter sp.]
MRQDSKFSVVFGCFACAGLVACGDDSSGSGPENTESSAVEESNSSIEVSSSSVNGDSGLGAGMTSSSSGDSGSATFSDTTKITYALKPFDGPLSNPHKGFTVPTGGAWTFVPEFEYGPYGSLNNRAWDLVSYGSGYQQWNKLNPAKGVYDWTELEKLLNALAEHNMTYALRVLPYTPSFIKSDFPPQEEYDWTPPFVYEMGAKKIQIDLRGTEYHAYAPVWDDSIYIWAAKEFAKALAEKYDGDPRIEYIDIRTFGEWGEWHTSHILGSVMPADSVLKDMLDYYASVFKKTQLVLPSNGFGDVYTHALDLGITKRDDGFIGIPGRPDTLLRAYNANLPTIAENIAGYKTMLANDDLIPGGTQKWTAERWVDAITTAHLTYYVLDQDNDCGYYFYKDNKALADSMSKVIGYNFTVTRAELLTIAGADNAASTAENSADTAAGNVATNTLNITIKNTGVAPCFFDVYLVAEFVDSTGKALAQIGETVRIPKGIFKDGASQDFSFTYKVMPSAVPAGEANLAIQPGVSVALSLYESEDAYKSGKNPTVRFDNDGLQENNKLLLKSR